MESGWIFSRVIFHDLRFVKRDPSNELRLGNDPRRTRPFHNDLKKAFSRLIYDPSSYLQQGFSRNNLCLPACILLAIHSKIGPPLRTLTIRVIKEELKALNYHPFLSIDCAGIPMSKITSFERSLTPVPPALLRLFPLLSVFNGISINVFTMRGAGKNSRRLFPISISEHARDFETYFMVDILLDSAELRAQPYIPAENHCLLISSLSTLMTRFSDKRQNSQNQDRLWPNLSRA